MNRCHLWQVRVMVPAGPLWLLGLNNIPPQGFRGGRRQEGQPQQVSTLRGCSPHSFSLLCNYHQRTSVCCSSGTLPLTTVLPSPWPIRSIVVDVMTKNKQCEGVRLPFVRTGRSPSLLLRGRISPDEHSHFLLVLIAPDRYTNTNRCICAVSDQWSTQSQQTHFVSWHLSWSHCPFTDVIVWTTCRRKVQ